MSYLAENLTEMSITASSQAFVSLYGTDQDGPIIARIGRDAIDNRFAFLSDTDQRHAIVELNLKAIISAIGEKVARSEFTPTTDGRRVLLDLKDLQSLELFMPTSE